MHCWSWGGIVAKEEDGETVIHVTAFKGGCEEGLNVNKDRVFAPGNGLTYSRNLGCYVT